MRVSVDVRVLLGRRLTALSGSVETAPDAAALTGLVCSAGQAPCGLTELTCCLPRALTKLTDRLTRALAVVALPQLPF
jgi:hypothetical protein